MSIRVMGKVWETSQQKGTALLLLLAIADFANDEGCAWPAVETLAKKIRMSERYTHMLISTLVEAGEITVEPNAGMNGSNKYWIVLGGEAGLTLKPASPVQPASEGGEAGLPKGVKRASPNPSVNRQEPPTTKRAKSETAPKARNEIFDAVLEVCQANAKLNGSQIGRVAAEIAAAGFTAADVRAFGKDWWAWKDRTKPPTVWKLRDTISQVRAKTSGAKPARAGTSDNGMKGWRGPG